MLLAVHIYHVCFDKKYLLHFCYFSKNRKSCIPLTIYRKTPQLTLFLLLVRHKVYNICLRGRGITFYYDRYIHVHHVCLELCTISFFKQIYHILYLFTICYLQHVNIMQEGCLLKRSSKIKCCKQCRQFKGIMTKWPYHTE